MEKRINLDDHRTTPRYVISDNKRYTWEELYSTWQRECQRLGCDPTILEIPIIIAKNGWYTREGQWIDRLNIIKDKNPRLQLGGLRGPVLTIHKFSHCETKEQVAAVWICATLWCMTKFVFYDPESPWTNDVRKLAKSMLNYIIYEFNNKISVWNSRSEQTLPIHLDYSLHHVTDAHELIEVIALESVLNYRSFEPQIIKYEYEKQAKEAVMKLGEEFNKHVNLKKDDE